jgi:hypothetical protein
MKKAIFILFAACCLGCTSKTMPAVQISLADSSRSLKITGLDATILGAISRDSSVKVWQSLIPVYKMPADTDMKDYQAPQPGNYQVSGSTVIFTPDTPFTKQQNYYVRHYRYTDGNSIWDYIKQQKKLGKPAYTDLPFKQ